MKYGSLCGTWARWGVFLTPMLVTGAACSGLESDDVDGFSAEEWKTVKDMQPLATPMPSNPANNRADDEAVARLGQMLFFEYDASEALTVDSSLGKKGEAGKVACVTCHDPKKYFADSRPDPTSTGRAGPQSRNSPALVNLSWFPFAGWMGQFDSLQMHGSVAMGGWGTRLAGVHYIYRKYRDEYNTLFPTTPLDPALDPMAPDAARFPLTGNPKPKATDPDGPWERMTPADQKHVMQIMYNIGRTWDAYPRRLTTHGSPFERYVTGDYGALDPAAKRGLRLFINKAACNDCHKGPLLSDGEAHNIAVAKAPAAMTPDMGRFAAIPGMLTSPFNGGGEFSDDRAYGQMKLAGMPPVSDSMKGAFRTPTLLNVAETGPYFHTGLVNTLEDVVRHYNKGGSDDTSTFAGTKDAKLKPLMLTDGEVADLVAFLKSLTGNLPDESWMRDIAKH